MEITVSNLRKSITDIGQKCVSYGPDKICIPGLIYETRDSCKLYLLLGEFDRKLRSICEKNYLCVLEKDNIDRYYFCKDHLHLAHSGKQILADNVITILWGKYFLGNYTHNLRVQTSITLV